MKRFLFVLMLILFLSLPSIAYAASPPRVDKAPKHRQPTEVQVLQALKKENIDVEYVELVKDYGTKAKAKTPFARLYKDKKSNKYIRFITTLPQVDFEGETIEVGWSQSGNKYTAKNNIFDCEIKINQVTLSSGGKQLTYQPQLFLDGEEVKASKPDLLGIDPVNENYYQNTLEWDYGIATRRLRLIEGQLQGSWIFSGNPDGDVEIRYNHSGTLDLQLGSYAASADSEVITQAIFDEAEYPLTIGDTWTGYSTSNDGTILQQGPVYADVQDWATGGAFDTLLSSSLGQSKIGGTYAVNRNFFYFATSDDDIENVNLTSVTLSLYGKTDNSDTDFLLTIQDGQPTYPHTPLENGDYDRDHYTGAGGNVTTVGFNTSGYNDITLNTDGRDWIQSGSGAVTKLVIRSSRDIDATEPSGSESVIVYHSEQGTGYEPKLVIIYTSALVQDIEWGYGATFTDGSGNGNDATPTFRTASSDADVTAAMISFQPMSEAQAPGYSLGEDPLFITTVPDITGDFTTTPGSGAFPLADVIKSVADSTGTPEQLPLLIIASIVILAASLATSSTIRKYGSGSLVIKIGVIVAIMAVFMALGNFAVDFWMLVVFLTLAISIAIASKQLGWT